MSSNVTKKRLSSTNCTLYDRANLPVCECGNVPIARSLIANGLKPADVISFLFAAPIINPITIISTMTAFSFDTRMVWWRIIFALIIVQITAFYRQLFLRKIPSLIQSSKNFATLIATIQNYQTYSAHHAMNSGNYLLC